jgi:hypothetical protein
MADASTFADFTNPATIVLFIAIILSIVAFAGYFAGRRAASMRKRELILLSRAVEQLARLTDIEYRAIVRLGRSLASALSPMGESPMQSPEAKAAYLALGPEPERVLEEAELVLSQVAKTMSWRYVPGFRKE